MTERQVLDNILSYMKEKNITKSYLAKKLKTRWANIYRIFTDKEDEKTILTMPVYLQICFALGVEPRYFFFTPLD